MEETKSKKARKSPAWMKFVIDGKILNVFASSKVPAHATHMSKYKGIELLDATREERQPYLIKEKKNGN